MENVENYDDCHYFYEDEVYRVNRRSGQVEFGMVVENSELYSSDEEESNEEQQQDQRGRQRQSRRDGGDDDDDDSRLKKGFVRVAWYPKGDEQVVKESQLILSDRSLMPGDVVRRLVKNKDTQRGYCRSVEVFASVQIVGTKQVIYGLNSSSLRPVEQFTPDVVVCLDSWVGIIKEVVVDLVLKFKDGSLCRLKDVDAELLQDLNDNRDEDCEFKRYDFYPGQVLSGSFKTFERGTFSNCGKDVEALKSAIRKSKTVRATITETIVTSISVHWQCRAYSPEHGGNGESERQPQDTVEGEEIQRLRMLNVFAPCTLQIGDKNLYTMGENDVVMMREDWRKLERQSLKLGGSKVKKDKAKLPESRKRERAKEDGATNATDDAHSDSADYEDVDDSDETDDDCASTASSLAASEAKQKKTKKPAALPTTVRQKKRKMKRSRNSATSKSENVIEVKPGDQVVVETLCTRSEAEVVWQDGSVEKGIASKELFPIHHLDDQEFFCGDYVVRGGGESRPHEYGVVQEVDHAGRTAKVKWFETYTTRNDPKPKELETTEEPVYDLRDNPDFKYRPGSIVIRVSNFDEPGVSNCGGQVLDNYSSGQIKVWWGDGRTSFVWPQDLYKIGEYDSDEEGGLWGDDEYGSGSDASWETESEQSVSEAEGFGQSLRPQMAADIQRVRWALAKVEEKFNENPTLAVGNTLMKQIFDLYKDCKSIDQLINTRHFDEEHFDGLVEKVKARSGRLGNAQLAMAEHVSRMFSENGHSPKKSEGADAEKVEPEPERAVAAVAVAAAPASANEAAVAWQKAEGERAEKDDREICLKMLSLMKGQLLKCHEELTRRLGAAGGQNAIFSPEDLTETNEEASNDLEGIMSSILGATRQHIQRQLVALFSPFVDPPPQNGGAPSTPNNFGAEPNMDVDGGDSSAPSGVTSEDIAKALYGSPRESRDTNDDDGPEKEKSAEPQGVADAVAGPSNADANKGDNKEEEEEAPGGASFSVAPSAPDSHRYKLSLFQPRDPKAFIKFVRKEINLLRTALPKGISVKAYEDRMDLYSVMIVGPSRTPYEDGLFFFDFQLSSDYPQSPPVARYYSYCTDRLNPNLYEDGKVCVSLLGTWSGKGTESWTPNSNMLQLLVSIQGLILVGEPYYNEAGYERQRGTQQGLENSRMYNEMAMLKLVQAMTKVIGQHENSVFKEEIREHFTRRAERLIVRLQRWRDVSTAEGGGDGDAPVEKPDFPLLPVSKGFCISLSKALKQFRNALRAAEMYGVGDLAPAAQKEKGSESEAQK